MGLQTTAQPSLGNRWGIWTETKRAKWYNISMAEPDEYVPDMKVAMWQTTVLQCFQRLGINNHKCPNVCLTTNGSNFETYIAKKGNMK